MARTTRAALAAARLTPRDSTPETRAPRDRRGFSRRIVEDRPARRRIRGRARRPPDRRRGRRDRPLRWGARRSHVAAAAGARPVEARAGSRPRGFGRAESDRVLPAIPSRNAGCRREPPELLARAFRVSMPAPTRPADAAARGRERITRL